MKVKYEVALKVTVMHDIDTFENLKGNNEFANDLVAFICDEATTAGGVACCEIIESSVNVKEEQDNANNVVYKNFMRNAER